MVHTSHRLIPALGSFVFVVEVIILLGSVVFLAGICALWEWLCKLASLCRRLLSSR
jgi:hypothetical protein